MSKKTISLIMAAWCSLFIIGPSATAQGTAFTYQGQLSSSGGPATGNYDLSFSLYAGSSGGNPVAAPVTNFNTPVTNGLFTVTLDFGSGIFTGGIYWLQIAVETNGGGGNFITLAPRQQVTPAPYSMYAANAGTAAVAQSVAASNINGPIALTQLAGNVITNSQSSVTLSGTFNGNGAGLNNLNASNLTSGILADARLSTNVDLLDDNQSLSGSKTFTSQVNVYAGLTVENSAIGDFHSPSMLIDNISFAANAAPALRLLANGGAASGVLSVSGQTSGLIASFGNANSFVSQLDINGNWTANSYSGNGSGLSSVNAITLGGNELSSVSGESGLSLGTNIFLNNNPIYLRSDMNHGLAYNGFGITNFPNSGVQPDGPVLWGYTGGALGTLSSGAQAALTWNASSVNVSNNLNVAGNLSANNTPGVNWSQGTSSGSLPIGQTAIDSCTNSKPATGYFVINATASVYNPQNNLVQLILIDETTATTLTFADQSSGSATTATSLAVSYVLPITSAGGHEVFTTTVYCGAAGIQMVNHNLTVMYFPRQNN